MKKRILISVLGVVLSGFLIFCAVSYFNYQTELKRNREYEMCLAKALKNSYKDIKEIQFSDPSYSDKPGGWSVSSKLIFKDGQVIYYGTSHLLKDTTAYGGIIESGNLKKEKQYLDTHHGVTTSKIIVHYSNGKAGKQ